MLEVFVYFEDVTYFEFLLTLHSLIPRVDIVCTPIILAPENEGFKRLKVILNS